MLLIFKLILFLLFIKENQCFLQNITTSTFLPGELSKVFTLTANYFTENLRTSENILNETEKRAIDNLVGNYEKRAKKMFEILWNRNHVITKRESIENQNFFMNDITGVHILKEIKEVGQIKTDSPIDILLFKTHQGNDEISYAAVLEDQNHSLLTRSLIIYQFQEGDFKVIHQINAAGAVKIETFEHKKVRYLIVAKQNVDTSSYPQGSVIYKVESDGSLSVIQRILTPFATDITLWENMNDIYLIMLENQIVDSNTNSINYGIEIPIYRWVGKHFDIMHKIQTYNPQKIIAFKINMFTYLAVANYQNDYGETDIMSEIYRYDIHDDQFKIYQKILTNAAVDVAHFEFHLKRGKESYLMFANSYEISTDGDILENTDSVVYKFVDEYFIPFQSIPFKGIRNLYSIQGLNNEFLLFANLKNQALKMFQYDGWKFVQVDTPSVPKILSIPGIKAIRHYNIENDIIIVMANINDHGDMINILAPQFSYMNNLHNFYEDMELWTGQMSKLIEEQNNFVEDLIDGLGFNIENYGFINSVDDNDGVKSHAMGTGPSGAQVLDHEAEQLDELKQMDKQLDEMNVILDDLGIVFDNSLKQNIDNVLDTSIEFEDLQFECPGDTCTFNNIHIEILNDDVDMIQFFDNIYHLDRGFHSSDGVIFEDLIIDDEITPTIVNDHKVEELISETVDLEFNQDFIVHGDVTFENQVTVDGVVEKVNIDPSNVLLTDGDQILSGNINARNLIVKNLYSSNINHLDFAREIKTVQNTTLLKTKKVSSVIANNIIIGDTLNGVDIETINRYGLRKSKDNQIISGLYSFDTLNTSEVITNGYIMDTKIPDDLIPIDFTGANYFINQDVDFKQDPFINDFQIRDQINQFKISKDNKLDILLKNTTEKQFITGHKIFQNVDLLGPLQLQGRIHSEGLERMNPVSMINHNIKLFGNYTITGNVTVEHFLKCAEMKDTKNLYSFERVKKSGLRLDEDVPIFMNFQQPIDVEDLFVDTVNKQTPADWLVMGTNRTQIISGLKIFPNNIIIPETSNIININNINLKQLDESMLKSDDLQIIDGKITFEKVFAKNIKTNNTQFKNLNLDQLLENYERLSKINIYGPVNIRDHLNAKNLIVTDNIIGRNDPTIEVDKRPATIIESPTEFTDHLTIDNLNNVEYLNNHNLTNIFAIFDTIENEMAANGNTEFMNTVFVDDLFFMDHLDDVSVNDFGEWLMHDEEQFIGMKQIFGNITVRGNMIVKEEVNGIDMVQIFNNGIFLDNNVELDNLIFENGIISDGEIVIDGNISSIKFGKDVFSMDQKFEDHLILNGDLIVDGNLVVNNSISGVNFKKLHDFIVSDDNQEIDHLIVEGDVEFANEPEIIVLNDRNIENLISDIWYPDEDVELSGLFEFENMIFDNRIITKGKMNGYNLQWLEDNYFSISQDQETDGILYFEDGVTFNSDLRANETIIGGLLSGIDLKEFSASVLRNTDQEIFERVDFEEMVVTDNFEVTGAVNDLDLQKDVMRYDTGENLVTGPKQISNVIAHNVLNEGPYYVQNIDILKWMNESVSKSQENLFVGTTSFDNVQFVNNLNLKGLFYENMFDEDHILLKNSPHNQIISGRKSFQSSTFRDQESINVHFKKLRMKKSLNNYNITNLLENQAYNNENIEFRCQKNFLASIEAQNVNIEKEIFGVTKNEIFEAVELPDLNLLETEYTELAERSTKIIESLEDQAYYLDNFEIMETLFFNVYPIQFSDGSDHFIKILGQNNTLKIGIDSQLNNDLFTFNKDFLVYDDQIITLIKPFMFGSNAVLFLELKPKNLPDTSYTAQLFKIQNNQFSSTYEIPTNGTQDVETFVMPSTNKKCVFLLAATDSSSKVYCEERNILKEVYKIPTNEPLDCGTLTVNGKQYLIIVNTDQNQETSVVNVWRLSEHKPQLTQVIHHVAQPNSLALIDHNGVQWLTIASGHVQNVIHPGLLDIRRFDENTETFETTQHLYPKAPKNINFAILPTNELLLYTLTDNPAESLIVYMYEGLAGFQPKIVASTIGTNSSNIQSFTTQNPELNHFVIINANYGAKILQAVFKGTK